MASEVSFFKLMLMAIIIIMVVMMMMMLMLTVMMIRRAGYLDRHRIENQVKMMLIMMLREGFRRKQARKLQDAQAEKLTS